MRNAHSNYCSPMGNSSYPWPLSRFFVHLYFIAFQLWCAWTRIYVNLSSLFFTVLLEFVSYFLSSNKGSCGPDFFKKKILVLCSFTSPSRTSMTQILDFLFLSHRSFRLCLFLLIFFSSLFIRLDNFCWSIFKFIHYLVFHFHSAIESGRIFIVVLVLLFFFSSKKKKIRFF